MRGISRNPNEKVTAVRRGKNVEEPGGLKNLLANAKRSEGEILFETVLRMDARDLPDPEANFKFNSKRKWTFDFAWAYKKVAVEIDGGSHLVRLSNRTGKPVAVGRHIQVADLIRNDRATAEGWRVFHFTKDMLERDPVFCVQCVREALGLQ